MRARSASHGVRGSSQATDCTERTDLREATDCTERTDLKGQATDCTECTDLSFMGTIFEAQCTCGYASETLLKGCGMAGHDSCRELGRCEHCREIVSVRSSNVRRRCPKCRRVVQVITMEQQKISELEPTRASANLECPRCGKSTMVLAEVGLWD